MIYYILAALAFIILISIREIKQYENGVKFRFGRYVGLKRPGWRIVLPIIERMVKIDLRILTVDIAKQQVMTKDNVPVNVNGVVYFKVHDARMAVIDIQDYLYAISQFSQTALRDVIGGMDLDTVLAERKQIGEQIREIVDKETDKWGLSVDMIRLQDVDIPDDLKRIMSRQAAAEREKRATIIKAQGDKEAAVNLAKAADLMAKSKGSMQLRTLQSIDSLGPSASNTVILGIPIELLEMIKKR